MRGEVHYRWSYTKSSDVAKSLRRNDADHMEILNLFFFDGLL